MTSRPATLASVLGPVVSGLLVIFLCWGCTLDVVVTAPDDGAVGDDILDADSCLLGLSYCEGNCQDLTVAPRHCGECMTACADDEYCNGGCRCRPGLTACGDVCVDLTTDASHCGDCVRDCEDPTPYCADGDCVAPACETDIPATSPCGPTGTSCVPHAALTDHPQHCGRCDRACAVDKICVESGCRVFYPATDCTACPCESCDAHRCCPYPGTTIPICVPNAPSCP